jgi:hypothetical protein
VARVLDAGLSWNEANLTVGVEFADWLDAEMDRRLAEISG